MNSEARARTLLPGEEVAGPVIYWMSRDQRVADNWALLHAQSIALRYRSPLAVVFCVVPEFLGATIRQYGFMLSGLSEVEEGLRKKEIPFFILSGQPGEAIPAFIKRHSIRTLVTDFDPLRTKRRWKTDVARTINIPFYEVDAHNIVPVWQASEKQEYAAYTIRPRIKRVLSEYLVDIPRLKKHPFKWQGTTMKPEWDKLYRTLRVDRSVQEVDWLLPGESHAKKALKKFIARGLESYSIVRNDPNQHGQSGLSPYLHFGQISSQRVALAVRGSGANAESVAAFLEELIVRKELSDNFCFYNQKYDSVKGFPQWAGKTLDEHRKDRRKYIYSPEEFEEAKTHDPLWNAAQMDMRMTGKMHGYMRMYWAKKILEWSMTPEWAMETAIYLNDRYELDGRDPNGYAGIAWCIGGVHDRAWNERPIFGKIRYMSYNGCRSKFDVDDYIRYSESPGQKR